ncbi:MAG TPA: DedA family protein [Xanthobacteraceae bacterium]|nr:DedA family protein [Xanthobacteraceae bacterium]
MSLSAYGQEMLALMQAHPWGSQLLEFVKANAAWAPLIVMLFAFGESLAVVGIFVPATVVLVAIGALTGASGIDFWPVWAGTAAGAVLGDLVSYGIGRAFKDQARNVWPLSRYPHMYERSDRFFRKWGVWALMIGRFFGPVRGMVPLVAGVFEMPFALFMAANVASAMVWAFVLLAPGFAALHMLQ